MGSPHSEKDRIIVLLVILLSLLLVGVDMTYHPEVEREYNNDLYPHTDLMDYFPDFNASEEVWIVDVFWEIELENISDGMQAAMSTLQGLVNRERARVMVDFEGALHPNHAEASQVYWDFFVDEYAEEYNLTFHVVTREEYFDLFIHYATGSVVYDTDIEDTMNVAGIISGLNDCVVADKKTADWLEERYGTPIFQDLRGDWEGSRVEIYERAFDEYYSQCNQRMLFASIPAVRGLDYLVACRGFVFCFNPGPFTTPKENAFTKRIMRETPADIPVVGWFEQPTGIEENYMIQLASSMGKIFLGGYRFPNKSFLTAYEHVNDPKNPNNSDLLDEDGNYPDVRYAIPDFGTKETIPEVGNKIYISFAITDGDNIGFMTRKMRSEMWGNDIRGTVPIAWSVNPLLIELVPPLMDFYYSTTTENDTFVCGPSGTGYFNPDFTSDEVRARWLSRTMEGMDYLDLRQIWLLNSFTTYETPYSEEVLEDYVRELRPQGIMLDYGDVPEGRKMWMQSADLAEGFGIGDGTVIGEGSGRDGTRGDGTGSGEEMKGDVAAPIVRSMHIWGDTESYMGKLLVESDTIDDDEPIFAFSPVMSADLGLDTIPKLLDQLEEYGDALGREVEIVNIDDFFYLLEAHFLEKADKYANEDERFSGMGTWLGNDLIQRSKTEYELMWSDGTSLVITEESERDRHLRAYHAYQSVEYLEESNDRVALLSSMIIVILGSVGLAAYLWSWIVGGKGSDDETVHRTGSGGEGEGRGTGTEIGGRGSGGDRTGTGTGNGEGGGGAEGNDGSLSQGESRVIDWNIVWSSLLLITVMMVFFSATLRIMYSNFWNYGFALVGLGLMFGVPLGFSRLSQSKGSRLQKFNTALNNAFTANNQIILATGFLIGSFSLMFINLVGYILIPICALPLAKKAAKETGRNFHYVLMISLVISIVSSQLFIIFPFIMVSLLCLMVGAASVGVIIQGNGRSDTAIPGPKEQTLVFNPYYSALMCSLLVIIQDIPYNRYLTLVTGYRVEFLSLIGILVPLLAIPLGFMIYRSFCYRNERYRGQVITHCSLIILAIGLFTLNQVTDGRIVVFIGMWLICSLIISGILLNFQQANSIQRGTDTIPDKLRISQQDRFFPLVFFLLVLILVIATLPPIAYTVYAFSVPIVIDYLLYSLPLTILLVFSAMLMIMVRTFGSNNPNI